MKRIAVALMAGALFLTACQAASEKLTEKALEQVEGVEGVDIDVDSGEVSVETDDGKLTIGGGDVPDGFEYPLPDGYVVGSVFTSDDAKSVNVYVEGADFDEIVGFYEAWIADQPGEWSAVTSEVPGTDGNSIRSHSWTSDDSGSFINVGNLCMTYLAGGGDDFGAVCVDLVQSEG